jgi:hypothetical protein
MHIVGVGGYDNDIILNNDDCLSYISISVQSRGSVEGDENI